MEWVRTHALSLPLLAKFAMGLGLIVIVPQLSRRVHLPAVVGLLLVGVLFGPYGLDLIGEDRPIADFFGELGKLLLMFMAGLEVDLPLFRRVEGALLAIPLDRSAYRRIQKRARAIRDKQRHHPISTLGSYSREVDRAHREIPSEGSRRAGEDSAVEKAVVVQTRTLIDVPSAVYAVSHRAASRIRRRYSAVFSSPGMSGANWPKNKFAEMSNPPFRSSRSE